jgi:hypothetical protein
LLPTTLIMWIIIFYPFAFYSRQWVIFFGWWKFSHFVKNIFSKEYSVANFMIILGKKIRQKSDQKKIGKYLRTNMKRVLKILYFLILNIANLAKRTYGLSPLEQYYNFYFLKEDWFTCAWNLRAELPQFCMFPWKYFFSTKWERSEKMKRELFT